jgi:hypothetical protein
MTPSHSSAVAFDAVQQMRTRSTRIRRRCRDAVDGYGRSITVATGAGSRDVNLRAAKPRLNSGIALRTGTDPLTPTAGPVDALKQQLVAADSDIVDLPEDLVKAERSPRCCDRAVERAELQRHADVRVVDVPVEDVADDALGVLARTDGISESAQAVRRRLAVQHGGFLARDAFPGDSLIKSVLKHQLPCTLHCSTAALRHPPLPLILPPHPTQRLRAIDDPDGSGELEEAFQPGAFAVAEVETDVLAQVVPADLCLAGIVRKEPGGHAHRVGLSGAARLLHARLVTAGPPVQQRRQTAGR